MKKLMFATAAMAAGVAMAAGSIETDQIVGFMDKETSTKAASYGPMFARIGTDGATYKLGDFTAEGMNDDGGDYIQFLDETTAGTYLKAFYNSDASAGEQYVGWWDPKFETPLDEQELPAGTAFLNYIGSGNTVTFRFLGEVERGRTIVTACKAPFIANPTPVDLTLADITAVGMNDDGGDYIQFLNNATAATEVKAMYVPAESYGEEYAGWWDPTFSKRLDSTPVPAGAGFLGFIGSGSEVTFVFPDPVKEAQAEAVAVEVAESSAADPVFDENGNIVY